MDPSTKNIKTVRATLADFVRTLFDRGIYFRSLHLGNIVRTPDGTLGLIDITDIRTFPIPLPRLMRKRNLGKMPRNCEPGEDRGSIRMRSCTSANAKTASTPMLDFNTVTTRPP